MAENLGLETGDKDVIVLFDGRTLETHGPERCSGEFCCLHHPSGHVLAGAPLSWRTGLVPFMERICSHGVGHPDPDSLAHLRQAAALSRQELRDHVESLALHACDGCCS